MLNEFLILYRLLLAAVLSGVVGLEREAHGRAAGLRTHILVGVGSALVMLTSLRIFDLYIDRVQLDPVRLAANVITGIGFLCAGTIIRAGSSVKGLTTAASIWTVAAIGLAAGCGFYIGAFVTTLIVLISLSLLRRIEDVIGAGK